jgi:methylmalonyl-CoA/ethylmalonyl-CoA epimerase
MVGLRRIHHIDVVVRDLDHAVEQYRSVLGIDPLPRESLPSRGIELARFPVGETWLILVQPTSDRGPVAVFLAQHGEGFFHMGLEVDDVAAAASAMGERGIRLTSDTPRLGVDGWKLMDIEIEDTSGAMMQLVEIEEA